MSENTPLPLNLHHRNSNRDVIIHILCWSIVLFLPLFFYNPADSWSTSLARWVRGLGGPLGYMVLFYLNYLWLVPRFYMNNHKRLFFVINIAAIALLLLGMYEWWSIVDRQIVVEPDRVRGGRGARPPHYALYFYNFISLVLVVGLSIAVRMSQRWQHIEEARQQAERSRTEAELSNLRNQLNPHFLLNTLNNIYALIAFDADKAQTAVEELSKLLRHVLYDNQSSHVPLCKEVEFINNYISLMKMRVTPNVTIDTHIDIAPDDATPIAPLLFISLIENAFKHGIAPGTGGVIDIDIHRQGSEVTCEIVNSNHPKRDNDKSGHGIGLQQVNKRLELLYPGHYTWQWGTRENDTEYFSRITIDTDYITEA